MLRVQVPVILRDLVQDVSKIQSAPSPARPGRTPPTYRIRRDEPVRRAVVELVLVLGQAGDVDTAVDDGMRDVDAAGAKLPRQRLRDGPRGELARGEVGEFCAAPYRGRRTRDDQGRRVRRRVDRLEKQGEGVLGEVEKTVAMCGIVSDRQAVLSCEGFGGHSRERGSLTRCP